MKKFEKILLALFVLAIPFQARFVLFRWTMPFNEWTAGFLWATDILFVILLIFNFQFSIFKKNRFLILFLAIAAISILQADLVSVAIYRFIKLAEYSAFFFFFRQQKILSLPAIAAVWVGSCIFQALIGIVQYVLQHEVGFSILGESVLNPYGTAVAVVPAAGRLFLRAYGTTPHPNVLAAILMIGLWAALWLYFTQNKHRSLALGAYAIILIAFLLTFSRVAIVFWILATLVMLMIFWIRQKRKDFWAPLILTVVIGITFASVLWPQVQSRLSIHAEDEAVAQRVFYAKLAGQATRGHLVQGIGIGQFVPDLMKSLPHYPAFIYQPAHSMYLLVVDEMGVPGFLAFLIFLGVWFVAQRTNPYVIVGMAAFLALGVFDHFFWTLQQGGLVFWGLLGILDSDII
ncbi:MAG: O-antigen ligase family protein [Patescibacteria group bacterium]